MPPRVGKAFVAARLPAAAFVFYVDAPITSVVPTEASESGGTVLTITAHGFDQAPGDLAARAAARCRLVMTCADTKRQPPHAEARITIPATIRSSGSAECVLPALPCSGTAALSLALNGRDFVTRISDCSSRRSSPAAGDAPVDTHGAPGGHQSGAARGTRKAPAALGAGAGARAGGGGGGPGREGVRQTQGGGEGCVLEIRGVDTTALPSSSPSGSEEGRGGKLRAGSWVAIVLGLAAYAYLARAAALLADRRRQVPFHDHLCVCVCARARARVSPPPQPPRAHTHTRTHAHTHTQIREDNGARKPWSMTEAYVLWTLFGLLGAHRFYCGQRQARLTIYACSLGGLGLAWLADGLSMRALVAAANTKGGQRREGGGVREIHGEGGRGARGHVELRDLSGHVMLRSEDLLVQDVDEFEPEVGSTSGSEWRAVIQRASDRLSSTAVTAATAPKQVAGLRAAQYVFLCLCMYVCMHACMHACLSGYVYVCM